MLTTAKVVSRLRGWTPEAVKMLGRPVLRTLRGAADRPAAPALEWRRVEQGVLAGLEFLLPAAGTIAYADRIVAGTYEPELMSALERMAPSGGCFYDVGAAVGVFSAAWMRLGGETVEAFEPAPPNLRCLSAVVERNRLSGVRIHELALCNHNGWQPMLLDDRTVGTWSMAYLPVGGGVAEKLDSETYRLAKEIQVTTRTLDDLWSSGSVRPPDVIKIDVEGAEALVLDGAHRLLATCHPAVICEFHSIESAVSASCQLTRDGYGQQLLFHQKKTLCNYLWTAREGASGN